MTFPKASYYLLFVFYQLVTPLLKLSRVYVRALLLPAANKNATKRCQGSPLGRRSYKQCRQPRFPLFRCEGCTLETGMSTVNEVLDPPRTRVTVNNFWVSARGYYKQFLREKQYCKQFFGGRLGPPQLTAEIAFPGPCPALLGAMWYPEPRPSLGQWHRVNASDPCIASMHRISASHPWTESMLRIDGPARWIELNGSNRRMTTMHRKQWTEPNGPKSRKQASGSHQEIEAMCWNSGSTPRIASEDRIKQSHQ